MFDEIIHFEVAESTHTMLQEMANRGDMVCGKVLSADFQTKGRGQGSNIWHSKAGHNIMMSFCWCPVALSASRQFGISVAVSVAIAKILRHHQIPDIKIKWPNDIWSGERKLAGMLVSNTVSGSTITQSIVSVGLNVNESDFPVELPNPVSMRMLTGIEYDRTLLMRQVLDLIGEYLGLIEKGKTDVLNNEFQSLLLGLGQKRVFSISGMKAVCEVRGVDEFGRLLLKHADDMIGAYDLAEIKMLQ